MGCFLMKIVYFNVRGLGGAQKQRANKNYLKIEKPDVIFLQETMMDSNKSIDFLSSFLVR